MTGHRTPYRRRFTAVSRATVGVLGVVLIGWVPGAVAGDDLGVWLSREDAARLAGQAARVPALEEQVRALEAEAGELRAGRDAALRLVEITERLVAAEQRLRELADTERDAYRAQTARVTAERRHDRMWPLVKERAAEGALVGGIGGSVVPGIGNLVGAVGGGVLGAIAGAIEALVSGP